MHVFACSSVCLFSCAFACSSVPKCLCRVDDIRARKCREEVDELRREIAALKAEKAELLVRDSRHVPHYVPVHLIRTYVPPP